MTRLRPVLRARSWAGLALAGLAVLVLPSLARASDREHSPGPALLILPFENTAEDASLAWLSTGLAMQTADLARGYGCPVVEDEERAVLMEGNGIPSGASLTLASALELGRKMRAHPGGLRPERLVLGRFTVQEGGELTLQARVIDLESERARPWIVRQGRLKDLIEAHASLTEALARDAGLQSPGRAAKNKGRGPEPPLLAFETYCRAMSESDSKKRLALLRRSLQEFPGYPMASFQAASLLVRAERWQDAAETLKGSATDAHPYEAEFHLLEASVALQRQDAAAATEAARRSLSFANSARAHAVLGRALLAQGQAQAARDEMDKAQSLDASEPELEELKRSLKEPAASTGGAL